ncbi:MAG: putative peptidoglycan glycosyltransferase FtsW [bacterium]|nr:putative peptidoglycan glycosyltransferase FtsW [bacterium]
MPPSALTYRDERRPDYIVIFCAAFLIAFGVIMLSSASSDLGKTRFGDSYYYVKHQLLFGLTLGLVGFFAAAKTYYGLYQRAALPLFILSVIGILLIFTPLGFRAGGAERWINVGPITVQPAEILKLTLVIYIAAWLGGDARRPRTLWGGLVPFLAVLGLLGTILLAQSTTSAFVLLAATASVMYFASGARAIYLLLTAVLGIGTIVIVSYFSPYRWSRIMAYVNPEANLEDAGYHGNQARIAIGSGGLWGVGLGESTTKMKYLPEPIGDSVFAVIAEELGFVGSATVALLFGTLSMRTLLLSRRLQNRFGQLLLIGFGTIIGLQAFVNIGAISGLIPLTGMPLPFVSYGGTGIVVFLTMIGVITNISTYTN